MRQKISPVEKVVAAELAGGRLYSFSLPLVIGLVVLVVAIGVMRGMSKRPHRSSRFRPKWSDRGRGRQR